MTLAPASIDDDTRTSLSSHLGGPPTDASVAPLESAPSATSIATHPPVPPRGAARSLRRMDSPLGRIELVGDGAAVVSLVIERAGELPSDDRPEATDDVLEQAVLELEEYFAGTRRRFDVPVAVSGTAFQQAVWAELDRVEFGAVTSYGAIGRATGRPSAGRAVGGAVGANPVPLLLGCHRVLASNNRITGYSAGDGVPTKVWLLDHEGIPHA